MEDKTEGESSSRKTSVNREEEEDASGAEEHDGSKGEDLRMSNPRCGSSLGLIDETAENALREDFIVENGIEA